MKYEYISVPSSRVPIDWLLNHNFNPYSEIYTFITYHANADYYSHYNSVESEKIEFICNTIDEFIDKVSQYKLMRIL